MRPNSLFLLLIALSLVSLRCQAERSSLIVDIDTGTVLHANNANLSSYPASLTKLMTLYLLLEAVDSHKMGFKDQLVVSARAAAQKGSRIGLKQGDKISVEEVILALIVISANDAAVVAAEGMAGSVESFARAMNMRAKILGMKDTKFKNASGLPDPGQVTTARDMAVLGLALYRRFPDHFHLFSADTASYGKRKWKTHNHFLLDYPGAAGLKTGYTCHAGYNLVTTVSKDQKRQLGVVLGVPTRQARDQLMQELMDKTLSLNKLSKVKINKALTLNGIRHYLSQGAGDKVNTDAIAANCRASKKSLLVSSE